MNFRLAPHRLAVHAFVASALSVAVLAAPASATTETFAYTGGPQTWVVPQGVTEATFDIRGAQGADGAIGGRGGRATATVAVTPGQALQVTVGGQGGNSGGGFNGGGDAPNNAGGGGGATDIRIGGSGLTDRVLVAGGGGGNGPVWSGYVTFGGAGGGLQGQAGGSFFDFSPGLGGSQAEAGGNECGEGDGALGTGGSNSSGPYSGGGGGGGLYGGGAGCLAAGGGGSGFGPLGTAFETGVNTGNGVASIEYVATPVDPPPTITDLLVTPRKSAAPSERIALKPEGATVELTLSEDAVVSFRVRREPPGPSAGKPKVPRTVTRQLKQGVNSISLERTLGDGKALKPHRYTLKATATDSAGQRSDPAVAHFRVLKP